MGKTIFVIDDDILYVNNIKTNIELDFDDEDIEIISYVNNIRNVFNDEKFNNREIFVVDKNIFNGKGSTRGVSSENSVDGFELAKEIKSKNPKAKVVLNSGDMEIENLIDSYNLEIDFEEDKKLFAINKDIDKVLEFIENNI